jgi:hypothetical protein
MGGGGGGNGSSNSSSTSNSSNSSTSCSQHILLVFLYSWDHASLNMKVKYKTNEMQQIHNLYYDQCCTCFGRYSPIIRSAGTVCAALVLLYCNYSMCLQFSVTCGFVGIWVMS